jgi:hypothetical protein
MDTGFDAKSTMRLMAAILAGKTTIVDNGDGTATVTFRDLADTVNRATFEMDGSERIDRTDG